VGGSADFFIGVADSPVDPAPDWMPVGLTKKLEAGAQFAQTQFCMDAQILRRYVARLRASGVGDRIPLLIGVAPLASAKSARWIKQHLFGSIIPEWMIERLEKASDPQAEGRALCVDLLKEYAEIPGVSGAHLMAPLNERAISSVIEAFRKSS
jgi:methylenetetrahydrofolate reductase (NADPH)